MHVLGRDDRRMYVWLSCGDCVSGSALPARLTVVPTNRGRLVSGVEFPRDSAVNEDVRAMFPPEIVDRIQARDVGHANGSCA